MQFVVANEDYVGLAQYQGEIPSGSIASDIRIFILNDQDREPKEQFKLIIEPEGAVQLGSPAEAVIYIMDDDCELYAMHLQENLFWN